MHSNSLPLFGISTPKNKSSRIIFTNSYQLGCTGPQGWLGIILYTLDSSEQSFINEYNTKTVQGNKVLKVDSEDKYSKF